MKILILTFTLLITGCGLNPLCGSKDENNEFRNLPTDPVFYPYIQTFNDEMAVSINVSTNFGAMEDKFAGVCHMWDDGNRAITINKLHWDRYSEKKREQLIFHELGHCFLGRGHTEGSIMLDTMSCPKSIMRSSIFSEFEISNCYNYDRNYYMQEL